MPKKLHKPSAALYPAPVVLVSCGSMERPNIITIAWAGVHCSSEAPMVSVSIRPSRYSHSLIAESREFVINIPTTAYLKEVDFCGVVSGRDADKFAACHFTAVPGARVRTPLIAECPVNLECTVTDIIPLTSHDLFLARVEAVHGEEDVMDEKGRIDASKAVAITYVTHQYYALGAHIGQYGFTKGSLE